MTFEQYALLAVIILQVATLTVVYRRKPATMSPVSQENTAKTAIILDTCALIDGRIRDLLDAGFITQKLYIPQRVIEELQYLADNGDAHKRSRARFGLDVVQGLQDAANERVAVIESTKADTADLEVDELLVQLALEHSASLYTTDYNLNKVARIRGVTVLNVNELAHAIRPVHLPGEQISVKIVQKGESASQGVGYLEDGTMTVVEGAAQRIGAHVTAEVERMLQTEAGKMVFARLERVNSHGNNGNKRRRSDKSNTVAKQRAN